MARCGYTKRIITPLLLALTLLIPHTLQAAAWTLNKGDLQVINNVSSYKSRYFIDGGGKKHRQGTFTKFEYNPYIEYGLNNKNTLGLSPRFSYAEQRSKSEETALTELEVFWRRKLFTKQNFTLSTQQLIKLPGTYNSSAQTLLGTKSVDLENRILAGYTFQAFSRQHFVDAEFGYRYRDGAISDELRFDTTLGWRFSDRWRWFEQVFCTYALSKIPDDNTDISNSNYRLLKLQSSALYDMTENTVLQLGITQDAISRNTTKGAGIIAAVWVKF